MKKFKNAVKILYLLIFAYICTMYIGLVVFDDRYELQDKILYAFFFLVFFISTMIPYLFYSFFISRGIKASRKDNLSNIDFNNDKKYYRDIIKNYNPVLLSYIDDFKPIEKKDIISLLMSLQLKRKLIMAENGIEVIDNDSSDLSECEKYVLESISNGVCNINSDLLKNSVVRDGFSNKLIRSEDMMVISRRIVTRIVSLVIWIIVCFYLGGFLMSFENSILFIFGFFIFLINILSIQGYFIYIISYAFHQFTSYVRTDEGEDINIKLEGLKIYIKDFGNLKNKDNNELSLWEDYLIYSVMFNVNKDIINKYSKLVNM